MEKMWDSIKKGLQDGAAVAINKAEDLTQLGRARLDIAAAKTRLSRLQSELGDEVYQRVQSGQSPAAGDAVVQELCDRIRICERELADSEQTFQTMKAELEGEAEEDK